MTFGNIPIREKAADFKELLEQRERSKKVTVMPDIEPVLIIAPEPKVEEVPNVEPINHDKAFFKVHYHIIGDESLSFRERVILCMITSLDDKHDHCFATNGYFADRLKIHPVHVSRCISKLLELNKVENISKVQNKRILKSLCHV